MYDNIEHGWIANNKEREPEKFCDCDWCFEPIYIGEDYYDLMGDRVCEECVKASRQTAGE